MMTCFGKLNLALKNILALLTFSHAITPIGNPIAKEGAQSKAFPILFKIFHLKRDLLLAVQLFFVL